MNGKAGHWCLITTFGLMLISFLVHVIITYVLLCSSVDCRCSYEFCYKCGAEWKDKKATCSCPLWQEENIWLEDHQDDEDEDDSDYDDDFY